MKRLFLLFAFALTAIITMTYTPAGAVEPADVASFLNEEYPKVSGAIIFAEDGEYYAEVRTNVSEARVEIYRQEVTSTDNSQRLTETTVGLATLSLSQSDSLKLNLPDPLKENVQVGDRLRLPDQPLVVRNRSNLDTETLRDAAKSNDRIPNVLTTGTETPDSFYRLTVRDDRLLLEALRPDGDVRPHAERTLRPKSEAAGSAEGSLEEVTRLDRRINDFETVQVNEEDPTLIIFGARSEMGFAHYEGTLTDVSWDSIPGNVLDVSIGPNDQDGRLTLLVVVERNGTVRTRFYRLNPSNRSLDRVWTVSHRWIRESSGGYYEQRIGLNTPFKYGLQTVELTGEGPRSRRTPDNLSEQYVYSPSYTVVGNRLYSINKNQQLEVFEDTERVLRTSEEYGGGPTVVSARNSGSKVNLNPEFLIKNTDNSDRHRLLLPRNIASGITAFRGLTSYTASRLYLLEVEGSTIDRLWESSRLPGYVSSTVWTGVEPLVTVVNSENETTRLFRVSLDQLK